MALPLVLAIGMLAGAPAEGGVAEAWVVEGRISDIPHSHPIQPEKGQKIVYVDTVGEGQIVAYVAGEAPPRGAWVRLSGTALRFETTSPRPGSTKKFPVKQLTVEKTEALAGRDAVQELVDGATLPERAELERAGNDAIPVLIAHLDDPVWNAWWHGNGGKPPQKAEADRSRLIDEFFKSRAAKPPVP